MHLAAHCITDLRSLRAVVRAVKKANPHIKFFKVPPAAWDLIWREYHREKHNAPDPRVYVDGIQIYVTGNEESYG